MTCDQRPLDTKIGGDLECVAQHRRRVAAPAGAGPHVIADVAAAFEQGGRQSVANRNSTQELFALHPPQFGVRHHCFGPGRLLEPLREDFVNEFAEGSVIEPRVGVLPHVPTYYRRVVRRSATLGAKLVHRLAKRCAITNVRIHEAGHRQIVGV